MTTVNIPADLFERTVVLNLSPAQTVICIVIPLLGVFPASFIPGIPFWTAIIFGIVFFLTIAIIAIQTPTGQKPLEWLPALIAYKLGSNTYILRPTHHSRPQPHYTSVQIAPKRNANTQAQRVTNNSTAQQASHAEFSHRVSIAGSQTNNTTPRTRPAQQTTGDSSQKKTPSSSQTSDAGPDSQNLAAERTDAPSAKVNI